MSILEFLGIYPEDIEEQSDKAMDFIEELGELYENWSGTSYNSDIAERLLCNEVNDCIAESVMNFELLSCYSHNLTNHIIGACFHTVQNLSDGIEICGMKLETDYTVNARDSHLSFRIDNYKREFYEKGSLESALMEVIEEKLADKFMEYFSLDEDVANETASMAMKQFYSVNLDSSDIADYLSSQSAVTEYMRNFIENNISELKYQPVEYDD